MATNLVRITKQDDAAVFRLLRKVVQETAPQTAELSVNPIRGMTIPLETYEAIHKGIGTFNVPEFTLRAAYTNGVSVGISYRRYLTGRHGQIPSATLDEVAVDFDGDIEKWKSNLDLIAKMNKVLSKHGIAVEESEEEESELSKALLVDVMRRISETHQEMIERLSKSVDDMVKRRAEIDSEAAEAELNRTLAHDTALAALDAERKSLELQSHMSERRRIGRLLTELHAQKTIPIPRQSEARIYGLAIFLVAFTGGLIAAYISYSSLLVLQTDMTAVSMIEQLTRTGSIEPAAGETIQSPQDALQDIVKGFTPLSWFLGAKILLSGLVSIGAFTYAASWLRRYYDEALSHVRRTQRLSEDVSRASWVIEAIHEVHQQEGDKALPPEWVEAVTRNLFAEDQSAREMDDASMALRALMGFTGSAKFGPGGAEVNINRRGARALSQAGEE